MNKAWRRVLFFSLVVIFFVVAPLILLYSQGIVFDFEKKRFTLTGAFYIKTNPKQAMVFLNEKLVGKTDLLSGSFKIKNLIPKKYTIEIKKEGYFSWKKELEIKEKMVTNVTGVFLFPEKIQFRNVDLKFDDFEKLKKKEGILCKEILKSFEIQIETQFQKECFVQKLKEIILLIVDDKLYEFSSEKEIFEKVFDKIKGWTKFKDKVAVFLDHEIWLFDKEGKKFLVRETSQIKDLDFFNEGYLVFLTEGRVKIVETDTRDGLNIYEIGEVEGEKIAVNERGEILILKKDGSFVSLLLR